MNVIGIIPARYGSIRFPGKALAMLNGAPLIQHVYEQARAATRLDDVIVATDDERIVQAVARFGGTAVMTSPTHRSGTDRIAEVVRQRDAQVILNIQGDEPLIAPSQLDQVAEFLLAHRAVPMATLAVPLAQTEDVTSPHVVKVVADQDGYALYFSRAPIPACFKHIGVYGYQREFLLRFPHLAPTPLEQLEQLEQLRALEHGYKIKVLETSHDTIGVDTPEDLKRVELFLAGSGTR